MASHFACASHRTNNENNLKITLTFVLMLIRFLIVCIFPAIKFCFVSLIHVCCFLRTFSIMYIYYTILPNTSHSQKSSLYIYIYIFITRSFLIQCKVQSLVNSNRFPYAVRPAADSKSTLNQSLQPATERSCFG